MAAYAACKRVGHFGTNSGRIIGLSKFRGFSDSSVVSASKRASYNHPSTPHLSASLASWSSTHYGGVCCRQFSQFVKPNGRRLFLVDTLALVRRLEAEGVPSKQAEAITAAITEVLHDTLDNVSQSFVSKEELQKIEMIQESNLSKFISQIQSSQEHHFSMLQHETEKLRSDIEKMRSELRYEIDKVTAG